MRVSLLLLNILLALSIFASAQNCVQKNLSNNFDFSTKVVHGKKDGTVDTTTVFVTVTDKKTNKVLQTIRYGTNWLFKSDFSECNNIRSYITNQNLKKDAEEDIGDMIVADLNFDGKDDIALKYDSWGNSGPLYYYYIQDSSGKFIRNDFLSEEMGLFPSKIDMKNKLLVTYGHAGVEQLAEHIYALNTRSNKWYQKSYRVVTNKN
jgi:hypothetical protein